MRKIHWRSIIYILIDIVLVFGIALLSFLGAYHLDAFNEFHNAILIYCGGLTLLTVIALAIFKQYKTLYTNYGMADSYRTIIASFVPALAGLIVLLCVNQTGFKAIDVIGWALATFATIFMLVIVRSLPRLISTTKKIINNKNKTVRTMVIGAGAAAKIIVEDSINNVDSKNKVVVLMDDDKMKYGTSFSNIPVEGPISRAAEVIEEYEVEEVIIAIASLTEQRLHEIVGLLSKSNVRVRRMPLLTEMSGPNDSKVMDVDINDLLSRKPIELDNTEVTEMLKGKTVLVTGAGGSIGSELVRQIYKTHPSTLVLFDIYENSTYDIQQDLVRKMKREDIKDIKLVTLIGSTYDEKRVEQIIRRYKPDYIYHAAAYKHVPLMEDSPAEAIRTNVIGTYNVAKFADKYGVKKMVLVSTDKAVRPTNTMGATKRFAETIIQYFSEKSKTTAYAAVRFGNVLGSNGSVVPLFKEQIREGGPITITHKDIIRYFMTIPEAVSLILQCGLYATGGEIFILDMGEPVKIYDLAVKLIRCAGLVPNKDIQIVETGLRPGEKLYEELLLDKSVQKKTQNDRIYVEEKEAAKPIEEEIKTISKVFDMDEKNDVKSLLASIIDTYTIDKGNK